MPFNEEKFVKFRHLYLALIIGMCAGVVAMAALGAEPAPEHLPPETPVSATAFVCDFPGKPSRFVAVIVTFANGKIIRLDSNHMFGLSPAELALYGASAPDGLVYHATCMRMIES